MERVASRRDANQRTNSLLSGRPPRQLRPGAPTFASSWRRSSTSRLLLSHPWGTGEFGVGGTPVLVSSTFHNPYSKGNIAYADVLKIGHEQYRTDLLDLMRRENVSEVEQAARLPQQTFRDRMTLYRGGKEIQILYVGRAHTRGDS